MTRTEVTNGRLSGILFVFGTFVGTFSGAQTPEQNALEENKRIARGFYDDLWFSDNTNRYGQYMAETYVVHDTGDRKNVTEEAVEQKDIADFFWHNGTLSGDIHYQIAEGDLVATRWSAVFEPKTLVGRFLIGAGEIPIINVFRIENGKIVEIWNHRHDIDTPQTMRFTIQGFLAGVIVALIPLVWALRLRRRLNSASTA